MFELCLVALLAVHLLSVNLAAAGPLVCVWIEWRGRRRGDAAANAVARQLARAAVMAAAIGVGLGLLALVTLSVAGEERHAQALSRLPAQRWWDIVGELLFYFACMAGYVLAWDRLRNYPRCHRTLAILAGTNLLYHFPPLFVSLSVISTRPELANVELGRGMLLKLLIDGEVVSRSLHHWLAAASTAGLALAAIALLRRGKPAELESREQTARSGGRLALGATLLQIPVGLWVTAELPAAARDQLLGGDVLASALFGASIVVALVLLQQTLNLALGERRGWTAIGALALLATTVLLMGATLHRAQVRVYQQLPAIAEQTLPAPS